MIQGSSPSAIRSVTALAVAVVIGVGIGYVVFHPQATHANGRLQEREAQAVVLQGEVREKTARIDALLGEVAGVEEKLARAAAREGSALADVARQREATGRVEAARLETQAALDARDATLREMDDDLAQLSLDRGKLDMLREHIELMDNDRLVLVELRKDMPRNEKEATTYWENLRGLAIKSDPNLGAKVNRVLRILPAYFEWIETPFTSTCDSVSAYFSSAASELGTVQLDLEKDVLLVLINRIDTAIGLATE